jgi:putative ABC transport system permease protein
MRWLDQLTQDLRAATRSMSRYPVACAVAVLSLAAGIGSTTATLSARNVLFLNPPPLYREPAQLSRVTQATPDRPIGPIPGPLYTIWAQPAAQPASPSPSQPDPAAASLAFAATAPARPSTLRTADRLETVAVRPVTPDAFAVIGVPAALGQTFSTASMKADAVTPAVLSERSWQTLFNARPDVIGTTIWLDDRAYTIVGVMPRRFWVSSMESPIWTPLDVRTLAPTDGLDVLVRCPSGMTPAMLSEQLQRGVADYVRTLPESERRRWVRVTDVNGTQIGNSISPVVLILMAFSVLLTLLIACSNVAILMIAQWTTREQEIGIRASLGASRGRLLRLLLTESLLVAITGGLLGVCTTLGLLGLLASRGGGDAGFYDLSVQPRVLIQAVAITLFAGLIAGLAPALYETRRLHANPLRAVSSDRVRQRWRHGLVIFEITVTVALLVVTAAMVDGYRRNMSADMGFDPHPLVSARIERTAGVRIAEMLDRLRDTPGIASVAASTSMPLAASAPRQPLSLEAGAAPATMTEVARATSDYFSTLQVPMRAGRAFTAGDMTTTARVAIVNATLARQLWPTGDPLGATIWLDKGATAYQVVGIVADYKDAPLSVARARVFLPMSLDAQTRTQLPLQQPTSAETSQLLDVRRVHVLLRATGHPATVVQAVRNRIREAGGGHVAAAVFTFDQVIAVGGSEILVGAFAMLPLIGTGILLTAAGIYSVLSFAVARRSRELAVRLAIGASSGDLVRLVAVHSLRLVLTGTLLGIGATFWVTRIVQGAGGVFDSPGWMAFGVPVMLVVIVAVLATWVPSRRVLRISPAALLRVG